MSSGAVTAEFAAGVRGLAEAELPDEVDRVARDSLLMAIAGAIGASAHPAVERAVAVWSDHGGQPEVPVLGRRERLDLLGATVANGAAAYAGGQADPLMRPAWAPTSMAAALGLGYVLDVSGAEVLRAFALGREVQARLARGLKADEGHPWNDAAVCAPVGCAVTAGLLLELDDDRMRTAMGIAAAQLLGHREVDGTMIEPYLVGKGAANGVHAALLAQDGLTGATTVLEHVRGFFAVIAPERGDPASVLEDLGDRWLLLEGVPPADADARTQVARIVDPVLPAGGAEVLIDAVGELGAATSVRALIEAGTRREGAA